MQAALFALAGESYLSPGEACLLYFVGVSQLVVPRTGAQTSPSGETVVTATRTIIRSNDGKHPL